MREYRAMRYGRFLRRAILWLATGVALLTAVYVTAGLVGGAIPANARWRPPATGITIYVETNGVHTDLILPKRAAGIDWTRLVRPEHFGDPRYTRLDHLAFGWGERHFYLETPTWADVRPLTVLRAAFGSDATLVHVTYLPRPRPTVSVRPIVLGTAEYRRLVAFIRASIDAAPGEMPRISRGYQDFDTFYGAKGRYDALMTCNAWTGAALRHAGVRVGAWTPFPATVMGWF
ncbi:TIGR02117 family protein [Hephaestia sp. GCM10023244]|uniref:TIGR02117 family protein n=1 Tax=unclassified Hephaestia TaxID=2631281 RepID=UPI00336BF727